MRDLTLDVVFAARSFWRRPRFALSAILTMSVAIGAATAVFSVVDRSLFRSLPYPFADRLVSIGIRAEVIAPQDWLFAGTYQEWRSAVPGLEAAAAWKGVSECDRNDGSPERAGCATVDRHFLPTLGVTPLVGRNFSAGEDEPGAALTTLISYNFWISRLGGDRGIIGNLVKIDGEPARVIGVLPANFETPSLTRADFLLPLRLRKGAEGLRVVQVIGRAASGLTHSALKDQLTPRFQRFVESAPLDFQRAVPMQLRVVNLRDQQAQTYRTGLLMLLGAVLSFVLMACANVASLLLARSEARRHEFAIRGSLGASKARLARQTLTESAVLGVAAGALGCLLASGLLALFRAFAAGVVPRLAESTVDLRVLLFTLALSLLTAFFFGLAPAFEHLRSEHLAAPRVAGRSNQQFRSFLVSLQFAVSMILLASSGLFLTSLWRLQRTNPGFVTANVVSASFVLPAQRYRAEPRQVAFFNDLERRLNEMPGVVSAAITDSLPPGGDPRSVPYVAILGGGNAAAEESKGLVKWRYITPGYFKTLGISITKGREFTELDRASTSPPIVINQALAKRVFGSGNPVGKRLPNGELVAGVAADARNSGLQKPADPEFYVLRSVNSLSQNQRPPFGWRRAIAVVRSTATVPAALSFLKQAIHQAEPSVAVVTATLDEQIGEHLAQPRFQTTLISAFALIGVGLAVAGLYWLTSFLVAARTREIGVRIALGATRRDIAALMMRRGIAWTGVGIAAGLAVSIAVTRLLQALLFQAGPLDTKILAAAAALLMAACLAGVYIPSARAARIEPSAALRQD